MFGGIVYSWLIYCDLFQSRRFLLKRFFELRVGSTGHEVFAKTETLWGL
jgi:hypothetical protein